jgi:hypothetical protein
MASCRCRCRCRGTSGRQPAVALPTASFQPGVSLPLHPGQNATTIGTFYDGCTLSYYANCLNQTEALAFCRARGGDLATYTTPTGLVGGYSRCGLCLHCRAGQQQSLHSSRKQLLSERHLGGAARKPVGRHLMVCPSHGAAGVLQRVCPDCPTERARGQRRLQWV